MEEPSKLLLGLEAVRGLAEYGLGLIFNTPFRFISPQGDGGPAPLISVQFHPPSWPSGPELGH